MPLPPRVEVKGRKSSFCPPLLLIHTSKFKLFLWSVTLTILAKINVNPSFHPRKIKRILSSWQINPKYKFTGECLVFSWNQQQWPLISYHIKSNILTFLFRPFPIGQHETWHADSPISPSRKQGKLLPRSILSLLQPERLPDFFVRIWRLKKCAKCERSVHYVAGGWGRGGGEGGRSFLW